MENCLLWLDRARAPSMNMATDELLLEKMDSIRKVVLRFYSWNAPSASFGYSQKPSAVTRPGLALVRRPTGGGVVYHDCDLTYTLAIPAGHPICELNRMESYRVIHEPVMRAILRLGGKACLAPDLGQKHDRATLQCFVSPSPNDVLASDGGKLAGAAQRRTRKGILHQGSVSLQAGRAESLVEAICAELKTAFSFDYSVFEPSPDFLKEAQALADAKYSTPEWNRNGVCGS
ncbi:MAG: Octanoyltransferase LipM [Lentisphaerae bacterium ADurb.Bin242]|nr:MAG: Octanoyltransferase LipM [Lentisphaerae bacterium ADurb.Bin242]